MDLGTQSPESLVARLGLVPHPEGGFYKELYRSADNCPALPSRYGPGHGALSCCTSIYYLVADRDFSAFHRIKSDELWYYHAGTGVVVHCLGPGSAYRAIELGPGSDYFCAVIAGTWFAAEPRIPGGSPAEPSSGDRAWGLVSCAVAPGFDFHDFELADRARLLAQYPDQERLVERLTRS